MNEVIMIIKFVTTEKKPVRSVLPVLEKHLTLGWSLQSDWENWEEIYRKPVAQLASWLS